jgi:hypothetical protein
MMLKKRLREIILTAQNYNCYLIHDASILAGIGIAANH